MLSNMTALATPTAPAPPRWHRPLLVLAVAMAVLAVVCIVGVIADDRTLLGVAVWEKPLKFALSTIIYAVTWSWLIGQLHRFRRAAWWAGTISALMLLIELAIIAGAAASGVTSHFNVSTPLHTTLWAVMAFSISALWIATFLVSVILFRNSLGDRARALAIRSGAIIALVGMALAFLMTGPTAAQLDSWQGVVGAHAVGVADGGPGLPILGWSTVAGDLRIPHFVGMHALQAIPIALILIELLSRRVPRLRDAVLRRRLVGIVAVSYAAVLAMLTWQALRGQSIVQPDAATVAVAAAIGLVALLAVVIAVSSPATAPAGEETARLSAAPAVPAGAGRGSELSD